MQHKEVLKRAWNNVVSYRALWIFGIILALTTGSGGGGGNGSTFYNLSEDEVRGRGTRLDLKPGDNFFEEFGKTFEYEMGEANQELELFFRDVLETDIEIDLATILITMLWIMVGLIIITTMLRYTSETSLIRMVDGREESGEKMSIGAGFRLGWSRSAWRLFLIDLTFGVPLAAIFLSLFAVAFAMMLRWAFVGNNDATFLTMIAVGLFFLTILMAILVGVVLGLLKPFFRRASALDDLGVFASIRQGYRVVRHNLKDAGLMWLIMIGIGLGWAILMVPLVLLLLVSGMVIGGVSGLMVGGLAGTLGGVIAGAIIFLIVLIAPLSFLEGLREVFFSSTWTITYRELRALGSLEAVEVVEVEA